MKVFSSDNFLKDFNALTPILQECIKDKLRFFTEQENPIQFTKYISPKAGVWAIIIWGILQIDNSRALLVISNHRRR